MHPVYCGMPKVRKPAHVFRAHRYLCYFFIFYLYDSLDPKGWLIGPRHGVPWATLMTICKCSSAGYKS